MSILGCHSGTINRAIVVAVLSTFKHRNFSVFYYKSPLLRETASADAPAEFV